jgi:hypothetical protein
MIIVVYDEDACQVYCRLADARVFIDRLRKSGARYKVFRGQLIEEGEER